MNLLVAPQPEKMLHSAYLTAGGAVCQVTYQCDVQIIVQEGFPLPPMSPLGGGVSRRAAAAPLPASSTVRSRETIAIVNHTRSSSDPFFWGYQLKFDRYRSGEAVCFSSERRLVCWRRVERRHPASEKQARAGTRVQTTFTVSGKCGVALLVTIVFA